MTRQLVVVDVESTGFILGTHWPIEVAAVNVTTGEEIYFVPAVPRGTFDNATGEAMAINRYFERGLFSQRLSWSETESRWHQLWDMLVGNTFGGSNPRFDADMVVHGFVEAKRGHANVDAFAPVYPVWHHRLADLAAYAGPALLLAPNELVGLAQVCERLGVAIDGEHTALGDARATAECFRKLELYYAHSLASLPRAKA